MPDRLGELPARAERTLGRRPGVDRAVVFDFHQKRLRFEIALMMDRHAKGMLQNQIGFGEAFFDIAFAKG